MNEPSAPPACACNPTLTSAASAEVAVSKGASVALFTSHSGSTLQAIITTTTTTTTQTSAVQAVIN